MVPKLIKEILQESPDGHEVTICGWVKTVRSSKNVSFIQVNDGSNFGGIQATISNDTLGGDLASIEAELAKLNTGASVRITGALTKSLGKGQAIEVALKTLQCTGECNPETYPLQKNKMSMEYLRQNAHLRARTNTFGAVLRVRNSLAYAVHTFFQEHGFVYVNTPIITCSDCEGAGQMFQVTTLPLNKLNGEVDYSKDFFGKKAGLTVSGQLEAETIATALSRVYTFGPTFRAENSNTPRHLSEFWMIEPEMAFFDLDDNMDIAEEFIKFLLSWVLQKNGEDLEFFDKRIKHGVVDMLKSVSKSEFKRVSYTDAIDILQKNNSKFEFPVHWGSDIATEHERFLTEEVFKCPVMCYDYPKEIKSFYMKQNPDNKTVRAVDVLVPGIGEIIGGSEREADYDKLMQSCKERNMDMTHYEWYLDLRRFGTVPHSGFGLGFERLIRYVTGMENIRDVIPYPRAPGLADF